MRRSQGSFGGLCRGPDLCPVAKCRENGAVEEVLIELRLPIVRLIVRGSFQGLDASFSARCVVREPQ
ncbi:unnamed protein product, partial [Mesorhabditis belari]|uniref:Uncharacterized protein n=1 Tax=Mesorhabditis belari TaxID=2138241 RepID=A0AAF3F406_9BILA